MVNPIAQNIGMNSDSTKKKKNTERAAIEEADNFSRQSRTQRARGVLNEEWRLFNINTGTAYIGIDINGATIGYIETRCPPRPGKIPYPSGRAVSSEKSSKCRPFFKIMQTGRYFAGTASPDVINRKFALYSKKQIKERTTATRIRFLIKKEICIVSPVLYLPMIKVWFSWAVETPVFFVLALGEPEISGSLEVGKKDEPGAFVEMFSNEIKQCS
jgi:hypothetical protein